MFQKLLAMALVSPLISGLAIGQDTVRETDVHSGDTASVGRMDAGAGFHLRGVLISQAGRSALINGTLSREGDRVGGARILEITEDGVRIRVGSGELTVPVGARASAGQLAGPEIRITRHRSRSGPAAPALADTSPNAATSLNDDPAASRDTRPRQREVQQGETLASIARDYVNDGTSLDQVMVSLYKANSHAFKNNINILYEGAVLRIPGAGEIQQHAHALAKAEIKRHMNSWSANRPRPRIAEVPLNRNYGPVRGGETLSAIARKVRWDGTTSNQMMMALFAANPRAFNGNINRLQQGAVLRIPDASEAGLRTPETATAEVLRQVDVWRNGEAQQARSAPIDIDTTAANRGPMNSSHLQLP